MTSPKFRAESSATSWFEKRCHAQLYHTGPRNCWLTRNPCQGGFPASFGRESTACPTLRETPRAPPHAPRGGRPHAAGAWGKAQKAAVVGLQLRDREPAGRFGRVRRVVRGLQGQPHHRLAEVFGPATLTGRRRAHDRSAEPSDSGPYRQGGGGGLPAALCRQAVVSGSKGLRPRRGENPTTTALDGRRELC